MMAKICLLITSVLATMPVGAQGLTWLQELAESRHGFRADFTYTVSSEYWEEEQALSGTLLLRGSQYRVETDSEIILSHGPDTYVYRPLENQVLITSGEPAFSPATLFGNFEEHYSVSGTESATYRGAHHHVVYLAPRQSDSSIVEVVLWMRSSDGMVARIQSVDVNETTMTFELTDIDLRPQIGPDTFELSFPQSAEVIDLRS